MPRDLAEVPIRPARHNTDPAAPTHHEPPLAHQEPPDGSRAKQLTGIIVITVPTAHLCLNSRSPVMLVTTRCRCSHCHGTGLARPAIDGRALIAAIVADFGLLSFTTSELITHSGVVGGRLQALLEDRNARAVGWALKRMLGVEVGGYRLVNLGLERDRVVLWQVRPVS